MELCVDGGQDLLDYLSRDGRWMDPSVDGLRPALIDLGGRGFITKREMFEALVDVMRLRTRYWFETAELPIGAIGDYRTP